MYNLLSVLPRIQHTVRSSLTFKACTCMMISICDACLVIIRVKSVVANYCCGSEVYVSLPQAEAWIEAFHTSHRSIQFLHSVKFIATIMIICFVSQYVTIPVTEKYVLYTIAPSLLYSCYDRPYHVESTTA